MLKIKPPCEITRTPQSITEHYKAHDWKNFTLYYSIPCLDGLMPKKYIQHWHLFVYGLKIFLQPTVSDHDFQLAKRSIYKFVEEIESLYGKHFMRYNVHLLLHIPMFIKLYGPLWVWSAFPPEHFNGVIKKLFYGTQYIPQQISKCFSRLRHVKNNSSVFNDKRSNKIATDMFTELMNECRVKNCIEYGDKLRNFRKGKRKTLTLTEKIIFEQAIGETVQEKCKSYQRLIYKNILFHTITYKRLKKKK